MTLIPVPRINAEDNAVYEFLVQSSQNEEKFYKTTLVYDEFGERILTKQHQEEDVIEYSKCNCKGFQNKKVEMCTHIKQIKAHLEGFNLLGV
jgi:hypothetical protein